MTDLFEEFINDWESEEGDFRDQDIDKFWDDVRNFVDTNTEIFRQNYNRQLRANKAFIDLTKE